jgi:hypothetical protein
MILQLINTVYPFFLFYKKLTLKYKKKIAVSEGFWSVKHLG